MDRRRFSRLVVTVLAVPVLAGVLLVSPAGSAAAVPAPVIVGAVALRAAAPTRFLAAENEPTGDGIEYRDEEGNLVDPVEVEHTGYDRSTLARDEVVEENVPAVVEPEEDTPARWPWIFPLIAIAGLGYYLYHLRRRRYADPNGPLGQS